MYTILDCYTDEPSGLGVPPYIGTYPRYLAGALSILGKEIAYITIDDLRYPKKSKLKTDIATYNKTNQDIRKIISNTKKLIVVAGIHTSGKYLSAIPATLKEIIRIIKPFKFRKILTGPAASVYGSGIHGGKFSEKVDLSVFDEINENYLGINDYNKIRRYSIEGAFIVKNNPRYPNCIVEIETSRGCPRKVGCSFCTESLRKFEKRNINDIINEVKALSDQGIKYFRLGKQSDFFARNKNEIEKLLRSIKEDVSPDVLHIDNINPSSVTENKVKIVTKYCTPGNVAALGVESFDKNVIEQNNLNSDPDITMNVIEIINKFGSIRGDNGMPLFLPGINILFGLKGETKETHKINMRYLKEILNRKLLLRRINIRQVVLYPYTKLYETTKTKFLRKNRKYYWKWRNEIRHSIDLPMLKNLCPKGTILRNVLTEIHNGNTTFCRQIGTYPLIIGIKEKLPLNQFINIEVTDHMLRSLVGRKI